MATNNKPIEQWNLDDYVQYFSGSNRLGGNSESFETIKTLAQELQASDNQRISHDMMYERRQTVEALIGETFEYVNTHANPFTSTGKERKQIADAFMKFCMEEKKYIDVAANEKYFSGKTIGEMKQGVSFEEIGRLEDQLNELRKLPMTEENVIKYAALADKTIQASEIFLNFQPEATLFSPVKEREAVQKLHDSYQAHNDPMRDLRTVRQLIREGKSWEDLEALRPASAVIDGKVEVVGANVSQRMKITHNGKTGFFTEQSYAYDISKTIENYTKEHYQTPEDLIIIKNSDILKAQGDAPKSYVASYDLYTNACKAWDKMPASKQKDQLQKLLVAESVASNSLEPVLNDYKRLLNSKLSAAEKSDPSKRTAIFQEVVASHPSLSGIKRDLYRDNADIMCELAEYQPPESVKKGSGPARTYLEGCIYRAMLEQNTETKEGKERYQERRALLDNPKALAEATSLWRGATGLSIGAGNAKFDEKDSAELTSRNVATSRMAELLGVGDLIAHSEKMTVVVNGKEMHGCFMEFAEGLDLVGTKDVNQLRQASQTARDFGGAVARDGSNLKLFDLICGQVDRHAGNLFTKVGELGEDGTRAVTGIKGIDNDLAFSRRTDQDKKNRSGALEEQIFVDREFGERISGLTREKVEYAVGDILNAVEIDAIMSRVERIKTHVRENAILLSGDEWELGTTNQDLEKHGKKYLDAVKELHKSAESSHVWEIEKHDEAKVISGLRKATNRYENEVKKEEELLGSVSSMFEKAEAAAELKEEIKEIDTEKFMPQKKSAEDQRAKRAAIFDKLVANKGNAPKDQVSNTEEKTAETKVLTSVKELEKTQRASDRGIKFGAAREKAAKMKELEDSFTEITREDIEKANKNVKKPMIGGHRKK